MNTNKTAALYADHGTSPTRLKSRLPWWPALLVLATMTGTVGGCSLFTAKNAQTVLDVAKVVCIVANSESDDQTIKTVCGIVAEEDAAFRTVLGEHRKAAQRFAQSRGACAPSVQTCDGGVCAEAGLKK